MTALEFILNEHRGEFTKDELNRDWGKVPPSVEEICGWMARFAEYHIIQKTKIEDIEALTSY